MPRVELYRVIAALREVISARICNHGWLVIRSGRSASRAVECQSVIAEAFEQVGELAVGLATPP